LTDLSRKCLSGTEHVESPPEVPVDVGCQTIGFNEEMMFDTATQTMDDWFHEGLVGFAPETEFGSTDLLQDSEERRLWADLVSDQHDGNEASCQARVQAPAVACQTVGVD
jgi:hypothetical protein